MSEMKQNLITLTIVLVWLIAVISSFITGVLLDTDSLIAFATGAVFTLIAVIILSLVTSEAKSPDEIEQEVLDNDT